MAQLVKLIKIDRQAGVLSDISFLISRRFLLVESSIVSNASTFTMSKGGYRQINKTLNICAFEDYLDIQQSRLPKIQDVEQISPRILRVLGQNAGKVRIKVTLISSVYTLL